MKKIMLLLSGLIIMNLLFGQDADKGDKKSKEILDRLTAKTESYKTMKAEFSYKMKNTEANIDENYDGTLLVEGNKYKLNISGQTVICDGTTIWTYIKDANEVQINSATDSDESITPSNLLSSYSKNYKSKFVHETFMYGTTVNVIDLTPTEGKSYSKVRVVIDKAKDQLLELTIFDKNGSTYSYIIKKFTPNAAIKDSEFTFNKADYPDADIVDMR